MADPVQRTVAEHLREIRRTDVPPVGWHLTGNVRTPSGLVVPARWLVSEFPEFAQDPLPPFIEACREAGAGTRWSEVGKPRNPRTWVQKFLGRVLTLLFFGFIANHVYTVVAGRAPLVPPRYFIIAGATPLALLFLTARRKRGIAIPQNPSQMLFHRSREFQQDFRVIPLGARDLLLGEGAFELGRGALPYGGMAGALPLATSYAVALLLAWVAQRGAPNGWMPVVTAVATLDFLFQYKRGCACYVLWGAAETAIIHQAMTVAQVKRAQRAFPGWRCSPSLLARRFRRGWRRIVRQLKIGRLAVAMLLWDLPALLVMVAALVLCGLGMSHTSAWWMAMLAIALPFTLARSPLVVHGHKGARYRAQIHQDRYDRYLRYLRRSQQREEGGVK